MIGRTTIVVVVNLPTKPRTGDTARLVAALTRSVRGSVVAPGHGGYDEARALHNGAVAHRPAALVRVASVADVRATLALAAEYGCTTSVRGAGHGSDGAATAGDVVVDLRDWRGITVDARRRTVCVRGGSTVAEVDEVAAAYGLVVPGSRVGSVGVAGSALAGGIGWLTPRFGTTRDNVLAAELVTDAGVRTEPRLARGAVVTSLLLAARPLPVSVLGGALLYRLADAADVLAAVDELVELERPEFAPLLRWQDAPPAGYVPGDVVGRPTLAVFPTWTGDPVEGTAVLASLRRAARPLADGSRPMTHAELQRQLDRTSPWGRRRAETTVTCREGSVLARLEATFADRCRPHGFVEVTPTSAGWSVRIEVQWTDPAADHRAAAWLAGVAADLTTTEPHHHHRQGES